MTRHSTIHLKTLAQPIATLSLLTLTTVTCALPALAQSASGISEPTTSPDSNLPSASTPVSGSGEAYTLGPGDRVRIDIFKVTQYSGENQVLVDGSLNLPQVGSLMVQGLTLKQAADAISAQYAKILRYPYVTVSLVAPSPIRVAVSGEVNRPGSYLIPTTDTGAQLPTLTKALQLAGGITQIADLRQVEVRRPQRSGRDQIIKIDLWEFLQTGNLRRDITLRNGDTIVVPSSNNVSLAESVQMASASFAADRSQPLNIAVVGEVYRPGPYTVTASASTGAAGETGQSGGGDRPPTITRAIQIAGGIKPLADVRQIQVRRLARSGSEQVINIDLWRLLQEGDLSQDLILQDRDTVVIPTAKDVPAAEATQIAAASFSPDTIQVNVVGEVVQPGSVRVPPNTPLNQAILAAGGFNQRARKRTVDLIRLNPNGTVTRRRIAIDLSNNINEDSNPPLRKDDIVVVNRSTIASVADALSSLVNPFNSMISIFNLFKIFSAP